LLDPADFVITKLRRGTEQDLDDAQEIVKRIHLLAANIQTSAASALSVSPKDTALFSFRKTVDLFCQRIDQN